MKRASVWGVLVVAAIVTAVILGARGGTVAPAAGTSALPWESDLSRALARAGNEKKIVMVDFYTDWCRWCKRMDEQTFADAGVQRALARVVSVKLDAERNGREAAARFSVDGYPTILFLDASGREVGRIPGYLDPGPFLQELENILQRA